MHICLICSELAGLVRPISGFGVATRSLAELMVNAGHQVSVIVLDSKKARTTTSAELSHIKVYRVRRSNVLTSGQLFREIDADIFHSQQPSLVSFAAQRSRPDAKHVVTCRDPHLVGDWITEFLYPDVNRAGVLRAVAFYAGPLVASAVRRADLIAAAAPHLVHKVKILYGLNDTPVHLPTPVKMRQDTAKSDRPTVCYVGRLDGRKRPDLLLKVAAATPEIKFLVVGTSSAAARDREIRSKLACLENVELAGFVDQFTDPLHSKVFSRSWMLLNTSAREGLPISFLEAAAHGCAIVSRVDPDGFATRFGACAADGNFAGALRGLIRTGAWRERGELAQRYVETTYSEDCAIAAHLNQYERILAQSRRPNLLTKKSAAARRLPVATN